MKKSYRFDALEGLRGMAAVTVLISHLYLAFFEIYGPFAMQICHNLPAIPPFGARLLAAPFEGLINGRFSVWVFWTISDFVLSVQFFLRAAEKNHGQALAYLEEAFLRRYPRLLFPVMASVLLAYGLMVFQLMFNHRLGLALGWAHGDSWIGKQYGFNPSLLGAFQSACFDTFLAYDWDATYNNVLWSIEPEFVGSVLLFAFLALLGLHGTRLWFYLLVPLIVFRSNTSLYFNSFVGGVVLADLFVNRAQIPVLARLLAGQRMLAPRFSPAPALVLLLLIIAVAGYRVSPTLNNLKDISYIFLSIVLVALVLFSRPAGKWFSGPVPMFFGRISFGLYLVHVPLICSFGSYAYLCVCPGLGHWKSALAVSAMTFVLSILAGYLLYVFVDRPGVICSRMLARWMIHKTKSWQSD